MVTDILNYVATAIFALPLGFIILEEATREWVINLAGRMIGVGFVSLLITLASSFFN